jgi:histidinol dehydrogenase
MTVARVREQRSLLANELGRLGVEYYASQANFITARLEAGLVGPPLAASGLVVRPGADLGLPGWVRISIGWAPQMAALRAILRELSRAGALSHPAAPDRPPAAREQASKEMTMPDVARPEDAPDPDGPIRLIGRWDELTPDQRQRATTRGLDKIFDPGLRRDIAALIEDVREHGDAALVRALKTFDGCAVEPAGLRVTEQEFADARATVSPALLSAIRDGIDHVRRFNEQITARGDWSFESEPGLTVGEKVTPIASAGLFVPSGKASYPSVLVQLATPAIVAGVPRIAVIVPPVPGSDGQVDPAVLVVAQELGVTQVFRSNGPAGIAALAFGTETVPRVRKIVGPGSPAVACAQVEVQRYGAVTTMLLGPSESLIVADDSADPRLLAADLLNEAEHGPDSSSVLVTDSAALFAAAQAEVARQLAELPEPRRGYAASSLGVNGGAILVRDLAQAAEVANAYAPEHMQIAVRDEDAMLARLTNAGEILVGQWTPVSAANFIIGCPASLPTSGFAVVSSGITADAFRKRTAVARADQRSLTRMAPSITAFTQHEGFPAHEAAVRIRVP